MERVNALKQKAFEKKKFDGFLIINEINALYFAGCPGLACLLMSKSGENIAYVYGVNYEQAKAEVKGFRVEMVKCNEKLMAKIAKEAKACKVKKLAVDTLNYENYKNLIKELKGEIKLKVQGNLVWELRKVKDEKELEFMRKASELTMEGMKAAYETIKPSAKEYEVAAEAEYAMRKKGSWGTAFDTIVASGVRSAFPHGGCIDREICEGDLVVVDIGAVYCFYRVDMTRTFVAGKPSEKQRRLYEIVRTAQEKVFQAIRDKAKAKDVDAAARKVIDEAGYGRNFVHNLGHGVGLEIHEPPTLSSESKDVVAAGNVVTNEPGIYLTGYGGVRIEDTLLVQKRGLEKLTNGFYTIETRR